MLKRIFVYLGEMFPLAHIIPSLLVSVSFFMAMAHLHGVHLEMNTLIVTATLSATLFTLMLRVMDEFKDYEDDLKNYPDRPLPSGRVQRVDLWVLLGAIILAVAALNLTPPPVAWAAAGVFAYSLLMFKWFFIEKRMRASLPLALYTHNPIVYIYFAYLFVTYTVVNSDFALSHFAIALPLGAGLTNWEVSRKIRLAENETAYTTYSKIWGFKGAIFVCLTIQSVVMSGMQWYFVATSTPVWLRFAFTVLYLGLSAKFVQFLTVSTDPDGKWSKLLPLRKFSEYQAVLVQCTVIIAYLLHFFN